MLNVLKAQLATHIDSLIVDEVIEHYVALKTAFRLQDWEKCLVRGGKLSEAVMRAIHWLRTGRLVHRVSVESEINAVANQTALPDSIRLLIPRAVRLLYDHRSQRGGAHSYPFDPTFMDCTLVTSLADWVLSELIRLYCVANPDEAMTVVKALTSKSTPFVEQIDGDPVILIKDASARQEIGLILHLHYPKRIATEQLQKWTLYHSHQNVSTTIRNMEKARLVHRNSDGVMLTALGMQAVEKEILKGAAPFELV